jgi:hypothetical protein
MKTLFFVAAALLLPFGSALADDERPVDPIEACKAKAAFQYHFEMMKIEGDQIRSEITHREANARKHSRHLEYLGELAVCEKKKR